MKKFVRGTLTAGVGADVDDFALGSLDLLVVGDRQLRFHHDGVLRPRFQLHQETARVSLSVRRPRRRLHIRDHPTVRAASILPIVLRHVLIRTAEKEGK